MSRTTNRLLAWVHTQVNDHLVIIRKTSGQQIYCCYHRYYYSYSCLPAGVVTLTMLSTYYQHSAARSPIPQNEAEHIAIKTQQLKHVIRNITRGRLWELYHAREHTSLHSLSIHISLSVLLVEFIIEFTLWFCGQRQTPALVHFCITVGFRNL